MVLETKTKLTVKVNPPYPIYIGHGLLASFTEQIKERKIAIITDNNVAPLYAQKLIKSLKQQAKEGQLYEVPAGEESKSATTFSYLLEQLAEDGFDRKSAIVALGGGIVGDLAGFTAASFMRGIKFYQIPTSLLAMVDASVGGKTGINLPQGKNLVGAFWQPQAVLIDVSFLTSLPDKEFKQGTVELYKHGLLQDSSILNDVPSNAFHKTNSQLLIDLISRSVQVKADIVEQDEKEASVRAYLNLGHTLAHALEAASDHKLGHGDAVAYGLLFNAFLAKNLGYQDLSQEIQTFFNWVNPAPLPCQSYEELEPYLKRDKKNTNGKVSFVVLEKLNEPIVLTDIDPKHLKNAWQQLLESQ